MQKTCIIIKGPTAVGKTSLAIQVAQHFSTEIISADSRQCFKELSIGVAKPSAEQLKMVPHHFINSHSISENVNAGVFEHYALEKAAAIFQQHNVMILAGGTGLYLKAFATGIDAMPVIEPGIRTEILAGYEANGMEWLQQAVRQNDPLWFETGSILNPHRLMRALEVKLSTGKSILGFQSQQPKRRDFKVLQIGLELPRETLNNRIDHRVDQMMEEGLLAEVKSLVSFKNLNALQTVGYKELISYFEEEISLNDAITLIKQHTRQYAKRQVTWFKKEKETTWCAPVFEEVMKTIKTRVE